MAAKILNLTINGILSNSNSIVRLTNSNPIISWRFFSTNIVITDNLGDVASEYPVLQSSFRIQLGTSNANLGTNNFIADIADTGLTSSASTSWTYTGDLLERGYSYYGQIISSDVFGNTSGWETFNFNYNSLPFVYNAQISPTVPTAISPLSLTYDYFDQDGDSENGTSIIWFKNGVRQWSLDNFLQVPADYLYSGDQWNASILPSDGYEFGQSVVTSSVTISSVQENYQISGVSLYPQNPTVFDPIYLNYYYEGNEEVNIRWFVNDVHIKEADNYSFYRFNLNPADQIFCAMEVSGQAPIQSNYIQVLPFSGRILSLKVDGQVSPISTSLTPILSWDFISNVYGAESFQIIIGSSPGASDILDKVVFTPSNSFNIPDNLLSYGKDYYVQLILLINNNVSSVPLTANFKTSGSLWNNTVDNSMGWTIESIVKITGSGQGIIISDGSFTYQLNLSPTQIELVGTNSIFYECDLSSSFNTITVVGVNSTVSVYLNNMNVLSASSLNFTNKSTINKSLQFGSIYQGGSSEWKSVKYSTAGAIYPTSTQFNDFSFSPIISIPFSEITASSCFNGNILVSVNENNVPYIYQYNPSEYPVEMILTNKSFSSISRISSSPDGKYVYFCHANGVTYFYNYPIISFEENLNFISTGTNPTTPETYLWKPVLSSPTYATALTQNGLTIDTSAYGGKWFYTEDTKGTRWFDGVDNDSGWTVNFSLQINSMEDNEKAVGYFNSNGNGIYVNDGSFYENITFFENKIIFSSSGTTVDINTTTLNNYILTGKNDLLKLYAKTPTDLGYKFIGQSNSIFYASKEGNSSNPSSCATPDGVVHCVWSDDGDAAGSKIYYSYYTDQWSAPEIVVSSSLDASNPKITSDGQKLYVVFSVNSNQVDQIGIIMKEGPQWSEPSVLLSAGTNCKNADISGWYGNIYVVWEDYSKKIPFINFMSRNNLSGMWSSHFNVSDGATDSVHPSIHAMGRVVAVTWTQFDVSGNSDIFARSLYIEDGGWSSILNISLYSDNLASSSSADHIKSSSSSNYYTVGRSRDSDYSDVLVDYNFIWVTWQATLNGESIQIWEAKYNLYFDIVRTNPRPLTTTYFDKEFPKIGKIGNELFIVWSDYSTDTGTYINVCVDTVKDHWISSGNDTYDIFVSFSDDRTSRFATIPKWNSPSPHIIYQTRMVNLNSEHVDTNQVFYNIKDCLYSSPYSEIFANNSTTDIQISGQLPRKEIRFGQFSDAYKGSQTYTNFGFYLKKDVEPFSLGYISSSNSNIGDQRSFDALVNFNGDAWIASNSGLNLFKYETNMLYHSPGTLNSTPVYRVVVGNNSSILCATPIGLFFSFDHVNFYILSNNGINLNIDNGTQVNDILIDSNSNTWIATNNGLYSVNLESDLSNSQNAPISSSSPVTVFNTSNGFPTNNIFRIIEDADGYFWVSSDAGLICISPSGISVFNSENSRLSSDLIYSVAVIDSNRRFIGSASGLYEMVGNSISRYKKYNLPVVSGNTRCVFFTPPNILWVSNLSEINQIQIDSTIGSSSIIYPTSTYAPGVVSFDDLRTYYVTGNTTNIVSGCYVEVFVNGNKVVGGYSLSEDQKMVQFESPLFYKDIVSIRYRNDFTLFSSLAQNKVEIGSTGFVPKNIQKMLTSGSDIYINLEENNNGSLLKYNSSNTYSLPYANITLDTTPPTGELEFVSQVSRYQLLFDIDYAYDALSGISQMIVSNYPNFTTDGTTPQSPVNFATQVIQTIPPILDTGNLSYSFASGDGTGNVIGYFKANVSNLTPTGSSLYMFVGTSSPANIFYYISKSNTWSSQIYVNGSQQSSLSSNSLSSVDFMVEFNGAMVVGVGTTGSSTVIYSTLDGINYTSLFTINSPHCNAAMVFNGILYIGDSLGNIWTVNGNSLGGPIVSGSSSVNGFAGYSNTLYAVTTNPSGGQLLSINSSTNSIQVLYVSNDTIIKSVSIFNDNPSGVLIYIGTGTTGEILSREILSGVFETSFDYLPTSINKIRGGINAPAISACMGSGVYSQSIQSNGTLSSWVRQSNFKSQSIVDFWFAPNLVNNEEFDLWVVTSSSIYQMLPNTQNSINVYLQLIDNAGNKSPGSSIFTSINLNNLAEYSNTNELITIDPVNRSIVSTVFGQNTFIGGQFVEEETAEYYSEIFFGTSSLIMWNTISFVCDVPNGTSLTIYVRTAASENEILTSPWEASFGSQYASGASISFLTNPYLQFKVVLSSTTPSVSPTISSVVIQSTTSQSTHFYTTNFILGSNVVSGMISANTFLPVAADVIFGFDTNNSTNFDDYQIIPLDSIFQANPQQTGSNLRVGIKFITPSAPIYNTEQPLFGPSGEPIYLNNINENLAASSSGIFYFTVTFYEYSDTQMLNPIFVANSEQEVNGFNINGTAIPNVSGFYLSSGSFSLQYIPPSGTPINCSTFYRTAIGVYEGGVLQSTTSGNLFIVTCNTTFVDNISFSYTPQYSPTTPAHDFQFRVRMYQDPTFQTLLADTYYSGLPFQSGSGGYWELNGSPYNMSGESLASGTQYTIALHPPSTNLSSGVIYYLIVDVIDLNENAGFSNISYSWNFRVTDALSDVYCGGYSNVPIVSGFAMMFELANKTLVTLNQ